jgi:hypothetical protein
MDLLKFDWCRTAIRKEIVYRSLWIEMAILHNDSCWTKMSVSEQSQLMPTGCGPCPNSCCACEVPSTFYRMARAMRCLCMSSASTFNAYDRLNIATWAFVLVISIRCSTFTCVERRIRVFRSLEVLQVVFHAVTPRHKLATSWSLSARALGANEVESMSDYRGVVLL